MKDLAKGYKLNNGVTNPSIGFGTFKVAEGENDHILKMAIEAGYRYFDTASFYDTETSLAQAIRECQIPREDFFITSKAWKTEMGYENIKKAFERTLEKLETNYLDMYLIHWPIPEEGYEDWKNLNIESWKAMEELYKKGRIKAIGVSNFLPHHIRNILKNCDVRPVVNQIEFHPGYTQELTVQYCQEKNILVQAWSPLGRSTLLEEPLLCGMAEKYEVSVAQICIRYALQRGIVPLPKSSSIERMKQNLDVHNFKLDKEDVYRLGTMAQTGWSGLHPDQGSIRMTSNK